MTEHSTNAELIGSLQVYMPQLIYQTAYLILISYKVPTHRDDIHAIICVVSYTSSQYTNVTNSIYDKFTRINLTNSCYNLCGELVDGISISYNLPDCLFNTNIESSTNSPHGL